MQEIDCFTGANTTGGTRDPSPSSPTVASTTSKTEGDRPGTAKCKICAKPVENAHFESHLKLCQEQKKVDQKKAREARKLKDAKAKAKEAEEGKVDGDSVTGDRPANGADKPDLANGEASSTTSSKKPPTKKSEPSAMKTDGPTKKTKKRKADEGVEGADKEPKKKKVKKTDKDSNKDTAAAVGTPNANEPPKPKMPKPKGPVNVELQCGVALPNGAFCARSLTCKSHSMGAKRSVPGRSAPYDQLLQQYQKKNQAKQQKALLANQAIENTDDVAGEGDGGAVDSEEEKDAVMKAIQRGWGGRPYVEYHHVGSRRRYQSVRRREMVQGVLQGSARFAAHGMNGAGAGAQGGGGVVQSPVEGDDLASKRASLAAALSGKPTGGQRKPSSGSAGGGGGGA